MAEADYSKYISVLDISDASPHCVIWSDKKIFVLSFHEVAMIPAHEEKKL